MLTRPALHRAPCRLVAIKELLVALSDVLADGALSISTSLVAEQLDVDLVLGRHPEGPVREW